MAKKVKENNEVSAVRRSKHGGVLTVFFSLLTVFYLYPIFLVLINSFKKKGFITKNAFALPDERSFTGLSNFIRGIEKTNFFQAFGYSVLITVGSVAVIILCTSMCAWYITRVHNKVNATIYMLCLFSMIVPFQMVMFTLSKLANMMHLSNPVGIILVYLGFGAGLAVFMFCGFVKSIPIEIEEAAMIDGCTPIQTFFQVVFPIMKPTAITVAILQAMWIWNDYLLPYLVLDIKKYKTIPIVIQYLKGGYEDLDDIQVSFLEVAKKSEEQVYECPYPNFMDVYCSILRLGARIEVVSCLMQCTIVNRKKLPVQKAVAAKKSALLLQAIKQTLRYGDIFTQYNTSRFLIILKRKMERSSLTGSPKFTKNLAEIAGILTIRSLLCIRNNIIVHIVQQISQTD